MNVQDAAALLGVSVRAASDEISRAYKRLACKLHPDVRRGDPDAHWQMVEANEARRILLSSVKDAAPRKSRQARHADAPQQRPSRRYADTRRSESPSVDSRRNTGVWPTPPIANSKFFTALGFLLRPTEGRVSIRVINSGVQQFTLKRHPDNRDVLYCVDTSGSVAHIGGVRFWYDHDGWIEPLGSMSEATVSSRI